MAELPLYTILVVDDNPDLQHYIAESITLLTPHRVVPAYDGAEGLRHVTEIHPDCVIIDVRMPILDGFQMVRALRGDPETADVPLVILTAMAQDKDRFAGLAAGADQYLLKPITPENLVRAIDEAVRVSRDERQRLYLQLDEQ